MKSIWTHLEIRGRRSQNYFNIKSMQNLHRKNIDKFPLLEKSFLHFWQRKPKWTSKKIVAHLWFILWIQSPTNKIIGGKKTRDHFNGCKNTIWQNSRLMHDKNSQQFRNTKEHQWNIYQKSEAMIILHGEMLKSFPLRLGTSQSPAYIMSIKIVLEANISALRIKIMQTFWKEIKFTLY